MGPDDPSDAPAPQPQGTPRGRPARCFTQPDPKLVQLPQATHTMHVEVTNLCLTGAGTGDDAGEPLLRGQHGEVGGVRGEAEAEGEGGGGG